MTLSSMTTIGFAHLLIETHGHAASDSAKEWTLILDLDALPDEVTSACESCHDLGAAVAPFMPAGVTADHEWSGLCWYAPTEALRDAAAYALARWALFSKAR